MSSASEPPYPHGGYPRVRPLPPAPGQGGYPGQAGGPGGYPGATGAPVEYPGTAGGGYQGIQGGPAGYPGHGWWSRRISRILASGSPRRRRGSPAARDRGGRARRPGRARNRPAAIRRQRLPEPLSGGYPGTGYPSPTSGYAGRRRRGTRSGIARWLRGAAGYAGQPTAGPGGGTGYGPAEGTTARPSWGPDAHRGQRPQPGTPASRRRVSRDRVREVRAPDLARGYRLVRQCSLGLGYGLRPWPCLGLAPAARPAHAPSPARPAARRSSGCRRWHGRIRPARRLPPQGGYPPQGGGHPGDAAHASRGEYASPQQPGLTAGQMGTVPQGGAAPSRRGVHCRHSPPIHPAYRSRRGTSTRRTARARTPSPSSSQGAGRSRLPRMQPRFPDTPQSRAGSQFPEEPQFTRRIAGRT